MTLPSKKELLHPTPRAIAAMIVSSMVANKVFKLSVTSSIVTGVIIGYGLIIAIANLYDS